MIKSRFTVEDDAVLATLLAKDDVRRLHHVKSRAEIRTAEEIANRMPCEDFETFKPLFEAVQQALTTGAKQAIPYKDNAAVRQGDWFVLSGQKIYVAQKDKEFINDHRRPDARLRLIYDNGTESDLLMRSLQRALNKDEHGRRILDLNATAGPLFSNVAEEKDSASGTVYVLRSQSNHPMVQEHRSLLHKIGVTGGDIRKRVANAAHDPTFLLADVEIIATYKLYNINRSKLENIIHQFFDLARLEIRITDRFGHPVVPREWFLVPLFAIEEAIEKIKDGTISGYIYDPETARLKWTNSFGAVLD